MPSRLELEVEAEPGFDLLMYAPRRTGFMRRRRTPR
jgi:hypothetical protein